jgi:hypothetical protein
VSERYDDAVVGAGMTLSFGLAEQIVAAAGETPHP